MPPVEQPQRGPVLAARPSVEVVYVRAHALDRQARHAVRARGLRSELRHLGAPQSDIDACDSLEDLFVLRWQTLHGLMGARP